MTLRGGTITHHEYIQVGKGRDVGFDQLAKFEAKVACGLGEQVTTRDMYRLAHRFDFFRMLSYYYTGVGFYINSTVRIGSFLRIRTCSLSAFLVLLWVCDSRR